MRLFKTTLTRCLDLIATGLVLSTLPPALCMIACSRFTARYKSLSPEEERPAPISVNTAFAIIYSEREDEPLSVISHFLNHTTPPPYQKALQC